MFTLALPAFLLQLLPEHHQMIQWGGGLHTTQYNASYLMYIIKQYEVAQMIIA
jgi:hypothetical protein